MAGSRVASSFSARAVPFSAGGNPAHVIVGATITLCFHRLRSFARRQLLSTGNELHHRCFLRPAHCVRSAQTALGISPFGSGSKTGSHKKRRQTKRDCLVVEGVKQQQSDPYLLSAVWRNYRWPLRERESGLVGLGDHAVRIGCSRFRPGWRPSQNKRQAAIGS